MSEGKKKSKGILIGAIAAATVIVVGVAVGVFLKLTHMLPKKTAIAAIEKEFDVLIGYDEEQSSPLIKEIHNGFEVEVKTVSKKGEQYIVSCVLSNYDLKKALETMDTSDEMTLKEYTEKFAKNLEKQEKVTYEAKVVIVADKEEYIASFTEEQLNKATGGLLDSYKSMFKEDKK